MHNAYISLGGFHVSGKQTARRILMEGFWWPSLYTDIEDYVHQCQHCGLNSPLSYVTFFHINPVPKWSSYIVQYLKGLTLDHSMPKHCQNAIKTKAANYKLIADQIYC